MKPAICFAVSVTVLLMSVAVAVSGTKGPGGEPPAAKAAGGGAPSTDFGYPHADLRGSLVLQEGCEESPTIVNLDISSVATNSGETANFPLIVNGLSDWEVVPPLPDYLLGTYTVRSLIGSSPNFLYGTPRPSPTVAVEELGKVYTLKVEVVPTTARMEGMVVDSEGKPKGDALVQLSGPDDITYKARSRGGGGYTIDLIGMGDARRKAEADLPVLVIAGDAKGKCDQSRTTVHLRAGVTERRNFVLEAQGALNGEVLDTKGAAIAGAKINLSYPDGRRFDTVTNRTGFYQFDEIPEGPATVTATCPKEKPSRNQEVEIKCEQSGYQRANFTLQCGCKVAGFITSSNGEPVNQAVVTLKPAKGGTKSVTKTTAGGRYAFADAPKGKATITAACPQGRPTRSVSLDVTCQEEGQEAHMTLDCAPAADFRLLHTGTVISDCTFSRTEIKSKGEALFSFPEGANRVEFTAPYTASFKIKGKSGPGGSMAFSPGSFTLRAMVRWTVHRERVSGRDCLRAEFKTIEEGEQPLRITVRNEFGEIAYEYDVAQHASMTWTLGPEHLTSCDSPADRGPGIEAQANRNIVPLCVAPPTVAGLVTGESSLKEHVALKPLKSGKPQGE